ncbi:MAG TPA: carboxypeptidase-like regulatory domain-containing protein [Candidatus Binatia bacterium]|nr:carboxypeptidase-like regulatory domain-containing protein [Candidatus Binatia bacterium]
MKRLNVRTALATLGLLGAFLSQASWAMAGTSGNISGTLTDAKTGSPIAGASIEIKSGAQEVTTTTDAHGRYVAFALQPDNYTLTAMKPGYDTRSVSGYSVSADQTQIYDLQLDPASSN